MTDVVVGAISVPYELTRLGVIMSPEPGNADEAEGVLNPGSGRDSSGTLFLLPRLVAAGNVSRIGLVEVLVEDGVPKRVQRRKNALVPERGWERGTNNAGTEDPRVTWMPSLGLHVMTYIAFGPLGPRPAVAISEDLLEWRRLGPLHFEYQHDLDTDLNLFTNKDVVFFPEVVPDPNGRPSYALLHRPTWDLGMIRDGEGIHLPTGTTDERPSIWISYVDATAVDSDVTHLTRVRSHRQVATPIFDWERVKIGAGPAPIRVDEGWLLIHHGVSGRMEGSPLVPQQNLTYSAGAMILDAADPSRVIARTAQPLLVPETVDELGGTVPRVVFPTAIEEIEGRRFVFYGMADSKIGVASLSRRES